MSEITEEDVQEAIDRFPFLSAIYYRDEWLVGIIQNVENQFVWMYDINKLKTPNEKKQFLEYGDNWYNTSNTEIPIEMFLGRKFDSFQYCLRGHSRRHIGDDIKGHQVNLSDTFEKRIKKKKIEIITESSS
ncbi:hypothetical protein CL653_03385 [bacterium]|nr:hypothetical protein [bacterium]|tara:strand:+ start:87 stop:479 length:393 start_codon:yes stop_codon:yes gene_type:complete